MRFEGQQFKDEFQAAFGIPALEATEKQLWFLAKLGKHIRLRCRNNSAFNNYFNNAFSPNARFQ